MYTCSCDDKYIGRNCSGKLFMPQLFNYFPKKLYLIQTYATKAICYMKVKMKNYLERKPIFLRSECDTFQNQTETVPISPVKMEDGVFTSTKPTTLSALVCMVSMGSSVKV